MTTGLTYSTYKTQIAAMAVVSETDPAFITILPSMIDYAENRISRDLDMISTVTTNSTYSTTAGTRTVTFNAEDFVVLQQVNVITPAQAASPDAVTRNSTLPVTKEYIDIMWPSSSSASVPTMFAMLTANTIMFGPWPDASYKLELVGTYRLPSLSDANASNFISTYMPDVLIMASMIYISAYQRNFGRMSDDPSMAQSYEGQYQSLLKSATVEEFRRKFQSGGWSSMSPAVVATPSRG